MEAGRGKKCTQVVPNGLIRPLVPVSGSTTTAGLAVVMKRSVASLRVIVAPCKDAAAATTEAATASEEVFTASAVGVAGTTASAAAKFSPACPAAASHGATDASFGGGAAATAPAAAPFAAWAAAAAVACSASNYFQAATLEESSCNRDSVYYNSNKQVSICSCIVTYARKCASSSSSWCCCSMQDPPLIGSSMRVTGEWGTGGNHSIDSCSSSRLYVPNYVLLSKCARRRARQVKKKQLVQVCRSAVALLLVLLFFSLSSIIDSTLRLCRSSMRPESYTCSTSCTAGALYKGNGWRLAAKVTAATAFASPAAPVLAFAAAAATSSATATQEGGKQTLRVLGMRLRGLSLRKFTLHYYYAEDLLQKLRGRLADIFDVSPELVSLLQVRPDEQRPRDSCLVTFDISSKPLHDQQGQLRDYLKHADARDLTFTFGGKPVTAEMLVETPAEATVNDLPEMERGRSFEWRRPGMERPPINPVMVLRVRTLKDKTRPRHERYTELEAVVRQSLTAIVRATDFTLSEKDIRVVDYKEDEDSRSIGFAILRKRIGSKYTAALISWLNNACAGGRALKAVMPPEIRVDCTIPVLTTAEGIPVRNEGEVVQVVRQAEASFHKGTENIGSMLVSSNRDVEDSREKKGINRTDISSANGPALTLDGSEQSGKGESENEISDEEEGGGSTEAVSKQGRRECGGSTRARTVEDSGEERDDGGTQEMHRVRLLPSQNLPGHTTAPECRHPVKKTSERLEEETTTAQEEEEDRKQGVLSPWGKAAVVPICVGVVSLVLLVLYFVRRFRFAQEKHMRENVNYVEAAVLRSAPRARLRA